MVSGSFMPRSCRLQHLAAAEIVEAVPDVQVGMADAGRQNLQQHLAAGRLAASARSANCIGSPQRQTWKLRIRIPPRSACFCLSL